MDPGMKLEFSQKKVSSRCGIHPKFPRTPDSQGSSRGQIPKFPERTRARESSRERSQTSKFPGIFSGSGKTPLPPHRNFGSCQAALPEFFEANSRHSSLLKKQGLGPFLPCPGGSGSVSRLLPRSFPAAFPIPEFFPLSLSGHSQISGCQRHQEGNGGGR